MLETIPLPITYVKKALPGRDPALYHAFQSRYIGVKVYGGVMAQVDVVGSLGLVLLIAALSVLGYRINHVI